MNILRLWKSESEMTASSFEILLTSASLHQEKGCPGEQEVRPSGTIKIQLNQTLWNPLLGVILPSLGWGQDHLMAPFHL